MGYDATDNLIQMLKDETGTNVIGMFLTEGSNKNRREASIHRQVHKAFSGSDTDWQSIETICEKAYEEFKNDNGCVVPHKSYDEYYILKGNQKVIDTNLLDELDENASLTKVRNAFIKSGSDKQSSRTILTRLAGVVARDLK